MRVIEGAGLGRTVLMSRASAGAARFRQLDALAKPWGPRPNPGPARAVAAQLRPMVLCGQGPMGMPCQVPEVVSGSGLGGLGGVSQPFISGWMCPALTSTLDRISAQLAEAKVRGAIGTTAYRVANDFFVRETGFLSQTSPWSSASCNSVVAEGEAALRMLNSATASAGGTTTYEAEPPGPGGSGGGLFGNWMGTVKTVAIAGAVIAGVVVVAPVVWELVASRRASRSR